MPQIKGGKIKALGAASGQRNPMLPDVPTLAEQGYPDTTSDNWYGLLAPAKTPPAIIAKLNDAFVQAINDPVVKQKLIQSGAIPVADTPEQFGKFLKDEIRALGQGGAREGHQGRELTLSGRPVLAGRGIAAQRRHAGALGLGHPHRIGAVELVVDALPFAVEQLDQDARRRSHQAPERRQA